VDTLLASATAWLETVLSGWLGGSADRPIIGPLSEADLGAAALYIAATLCVWTLAAFYLRRRSRLVPKSGADPDLHPRFIKAVGKPLYVLILIYGAYVAATPFLLKMHPEQGLTEARGIMNIVFDVAAFAALFWFLFRATHIVEMRLAKWTTGTSSKIDDLLVPLIGTVSRIVIVVVAIILALPLLHLPAEFAGTVGKLTSMILIGAVAFVLFRAVAVGKRLVLSRFDLSADDNLRARQIYTQIAILSRIVYVIIALFAVAATLMLFDEVRHIGTSLLASAGIVGIVAGFAAQKALANLFAGFQIALSQPVRQDDVVIVEGEWGRIEEITLSYIIVHIWDDRRLVVPLSYFIEKPFQNWTRSSAALTGSVFVWVDYGFPVEAARVALKDIIEGCALWDKRFWNLQVSDASEKSMQLRILVTASNSSRAWDLRCEIREKFIAYIQREYPKSLPRLRTELPVVDEENDAAPSAG
jgi:small-conductance mechanosensitive channel